MLKKYFLQVLIITLFSSFVYCQDNTADTVRRNEQKNGWHYYAEGKYRKSLEYLEAERKEYPNRINIFIIMGWDYRELKQFSQMENISLEGLKINPTDVRIIKNLAEAYFYQSKFQKAIDSFEKYLKYRYQKNDPYLASIYYFLGYSYLKTDSYHKADIALSTANYYKKNNLLTYVYLGETNEKLEKYNKAVEYYNLALKLQPGNKIANEGIVRVQAKVNE